MPSCLRFRYLGMQDRPVTATAAALKHLAVVSLLPISSLARCNVRHLCPAASPSSLIVDASTGPDCNLSRSHSAGGSTFAARGRVSTFLARRFRRPKPRPRSFRPALAPTRCCAGSPVIENASPVPSWAKLFLPGRSSRRSLSFGSRVRCQTARAIAVNARLPGALVVCLAVGIAADRLAPMGHDKQGRAVPFGQPCQRGKQCAAPRCLGTHPRCP